VCGRSASTVRRGEGPIRRSFLPLSASQDGTVKLWNPALSRLEATFHGGKPQFGVAFSSDGKILASAGWDEKADDRLKAWTLATGKRRRPVDRIEVRPTSLAFVPNYPAVVLGGLGDDKANEGKIELFDLRSREAETRVDAHSKLIQCLAVSPDGRLLASGSQDATVKVWELHDAHEVKAVALFSAHRSSIIALAFSPDSRILASADSGSTVKLWTITRD
jgi:WD40 repeat protein